MFGCPAVAGGLQYDDSRLGVVRLRLRKGAPECLSSTRRCELVKPGARSSARLSIAGGRMYRVEAVVVGAGVVGLAVARALAQTGREVLVLEAEPAIGTVTSSRNSEVIHSGIYYPTGSFKARLCVSGRDALYRYCVSKGVPHRRVGKLIVATSADEVPVLASYREQAAANGVHDLVELTAEQVSAMEPAVLCMAGLLAPSTGIIDSHALMLSYWADLEACGSTVLCGNAVVGGELRDREIVLRVSDSENTELCAGLVVNCAGLNAQQVSRQLHGVSDQAVPQRHLAKGHYFTLSGRPPFGRLVYPIANSAGLGVHVTLDLSGAVRFGPDVHWIEYVDYRFQEGLRGEFARAIRLYYPQLDETRLQPSYTGIRPKISGPRQPAADFCIQGPSAHGGCPYAALYGIESPGLTASLALAEVVAGLFADMH
jgi:L-2-hydroxyglutarate oxidase LhgO